MLNYLTTFVEGDKDNLVLNHQNQLRDTGIWYLEIHSFFIKLPDNKAYEGHISLSCSGVTTFFSDASGTKLVKTPLHIFCVSKKSTDPRYTFLNLSDSKRFKLVHSEFTLQFFINELTQQKLPEDSTFGIHFSLSRIV